LRFYNVLKNFVKNIRLKQQKKNILLRMNRKASADKVFRTLAHVRPHEPCISKLLAGRDEDKYEISHLVWFFFILKVFLF
jgi:hypothetical protein